MYIAFYLPRPHSHHPLSPSPHPDVVYSSRDIAVRIYFIHIFTIYLCTIRYNSIYYKRWHGYRGNDELLLRITMSCRTRNRLLKNFYLMNIKLPKYIITYYYLWYICIYIYFLHTVAIVYKLEYYIDTHIYNCLWINII